MVTDMKISVIVPVYNVAAYVEACLRSIMNQTYRNLEILVTDDGSTDDSGRICDVLAAEDARIHVIHQENGGLSAARNAAIRIAAGDYIAPVDSDDVLESTYLEQLLKACADNNAQAAVCDYREVPDLEGVPGSSTVRPNARSELSKETASENVENIDAGGSHENPISIENGCKVRVFSAQECLRNMYHPITSGMSFTAWGKIYKRELFTDNEILYPAGRIHEDQFTTYQLIAGADRIAYVPKELYDYRIRQGSIMQKPFARNRLDLMDATREQCEFFLARKEGEIAGLAVNNHLRTEYSLLANLKERKCAMQKGSMGQTGANGAEQIREYESMEQEILTAIRTDTSHFLPLVSLSPARKMIFRLAAAMPMRAIVNQLRMF